jgi:uncharacterized protein (TIGR03437 family)
MTKVCLLAALSFAALFSTNASAQTIGFSFTGTGSGQTASGTGTLTPGGAATFTGAVRDTMNDPCDQSFQIVISITAANGDLLKVQFDATDGSDSGNTTTIKGTLTPVAGSKGAYANLGGSGNMTLVVTNTATGVSFTSTGSITLAGPLVTKANVFPSGITNVFSDQRTLSPGAWASIFGENMANSTATWNGDFPTALGNVTGTLDSKAIYFWFVSASQINFQVPDGTKTGCVTLTLNTPNGSVSKLIDVQSAQPSFSLLDDKYVAAIIPVPNGSGAYGSGINSYDIAGPVGRFAYKTRPVKRGESLVIYGVGFGPTNPPVAAGKVFPVPGTNVTSARSTFQWNFFIPTGPTTGVPIPVNFVGLVGAGLYQINATIPQNAPLGDVQLKSFLANSNNGPGTQNYPVYITIGQ